MTTIELARQNVKGVNRFITDEYLDSLTVEGILAFCSPIERSHFEQKLKREGVIKEDKEVV
jgi:hypothetical protein